MLYAMDPAIKLFGRSILLPEKDIFGETAKPHVEVPIPNTSGKLGTIEKNSFLCMNNNGEDTNQSSDSTVMATQGTGQDQFEATATGQEKAMRRPDKVLQCPRCNSMDTKFCYYNNYNINQPRYFCKNCQRYWTAGGTMRNVPVGAGRRKNKHSTSHFRHVTTSSDGMQCGRVDAADSSHSEALLGGLSPHIVPPNATGTVLKPGQEGPLCDTMASVLNISEQKRSAEMGSITCGGETKEEPSCSSSVTVPSCSGNEFPGTAGCVEQTGSKTSCDGVAPLHHLQCYSSVPWTYPWSLGLNNLTAMATSQCSSMLSCTLENGNPGPIAWKPPPVIASPLFCAPSIPFPIISTSFLGCMPGWPNLALNVPWPDSNGGISSSSSTSNSRCSGNGSPTLGKHCRDASGLSEEKTEKSLWVPKTLRIDDPDVAAKSSIWATLGIRSNEDIKKGGLFKAFHSMSESKVQTPEAAHVLHANPAALSRSQTFQENT